MKKAKKALRAAGQRRQREHPEDRKARLEGQEYGRTHAAEFCAEYAPAFKRLIGIYSDGRAHDVLDNLREMFWARVWQPDGAPQAPLGRRQGGRK